MTEGDWPAWHTQYDDPGSDLGRRLAVVQQEIRRWLDVRPAGPARLLSICAGQGHDVVGALRNHPRRDEVAGLLVEREPRNAAVAVDALRSSGLTRFRVVVGDAGRTSSLADGVPADLVLACGVFGNIPDAEVRRTIDALPTLCWAGGTVIWTRHRRPPDLTPTIREWFSAAGFEEVAFTSPGPDQFAVGVHRLVTSPKPLAGDHRLFSFDGSGRNA